MTSGRPGGDRILAWMRVVNAAAMSAYRMFSDLGYVIGPIALGVASDLAGADAALGATAALLVAVALAFARWAAESLRAVPR